MSNNKVFIVGAGADGLAVAACLKQAGIPNLTLEKGDQVDANGLPPTPRRFLAERFIHSR